MVEDIGGEDVVGCGLVVVEVDVEQDLVGDPEGVEETEGDAYSVVVVRDVAHKAIACIGYEIVETSGVITLEEIAEIEQYLCLQGEILKTALYSLFANKPLSPKSVELKSQTDSGSEPFAGCHGETDIIPERIERTA